jgi:hypothetical protein
LRCLTKKTTSQIKIIEKSRRVGLSWSDALESTLTAAAPALEGGSDCYYMGYNREMAETYIEDVATWARELNMQCSASQKILKDEDKDILVFRVKFASGHKVAALSSKPTNFRSKKGRVVLDEFAFHNNPEELLKAAIALLIWGGRLAIISTHYGESNAFNTIIKEIRAGLRPEWSLHRTTFDEALADGLGPRVAARQKQVWSPEWEKSWRDNIYATYGVMAQEELDCIPGTYQGNLAFNHFRQDAHVARCDYEPRWPLHISFDFNRHPATATIGQLRHNGDGFNRLYVLEEIYLTHSDTFKLGAEARARIEAYNPWATYVHGDATGRIETANSKQSNWDIIRKSLAGLPLNWRVKESNRPVVETLNACNNAFLEGRVQVDPGCKELIQDLNSVKLVERSDGKVELDKKSDILRCQVSDTFRYLCSALLPYKGGGGSAIDHQPVIATSPNRVDREALGVVPVVSESGKVTMRGLNPFVDERRRMAKRKLPRFG